MQVTGRNVLALSPMQWIIRYFWQCRDPMSMAQQKLTKSNRKTLEANPRFQEVMWQRLKVDSSM